MNIVREKASTLNDKPQQIIGEATGRIPEYVQAALPSVPAISKTAQSILKRTNSAPCAPTSLSELAIDGSFQRHLLEKISFFFQRKEILMSLVFVPSQDAIKSFQDLANSQFYQQHEEILCSIMDYFEDNWIGHPTHGNRQRPPSVPLEIWNQYEGTLAGLPKTNNYIEYLEDDLEESGSNSSSETEDLSDTNLTGTIEKLKKQI
ncbi:hypothetical protein ILUMI_10406 [Ignelater luminosus]|uniref:Uncharacterized protein n=1 Tax=Ignelater luminosus TaxID=2038154 RepID=A0A8K0GDN4_IGNLU|nr:hypothetical protein ILUMI_10406 [Ignelater luminosus]